MFLTAAQILWEYREAFLKGLAVTLEMSAIIWSVGIVLGFTLGWLGATYRDSVGQVVRWTSFVLGGVPILVFLFWLHYPAQAMFNLVIDPFYTATFTFTVINVVAIAELVRGALMDFPQQYLTAAKVCGVPARQTFLRIQLPLLLRGVIPALLMLQIVMLHTTLFASLISVEEIFRIAQRINALIYKPVEIYTALGVFFLAVSLPVNGFALWFKARYTRDTSEN
ncbi:MAG: ABC transporter permease subunit [Proteobacteria bacterium]|nr:ABC transporter permease subunit [Pseudomonadota bacterium]